jgi:excisionase family DNA binding protein
MKSEKTLSDQRAAARKKIREKADSQRRTLTVEEAGRALGISRGAAYGYVRSGVLPCIRLGGRLLIPRAAFERLLEEGTQPAV